MIYDITPFSIVDYPNKISCIVWCYGCNLRCKYCYNEHIIYGKTQIDKEAYEEFLLSRVGLLDGVVFSGGECTLHACLPEYVSYAKKLGFKVKIDSNGSNPLMINRLLEGKLVDYFAIDFKAPKEKFTQIAGYDYYDEFLQSLDFLVKSDVEFEIRTTWHFDLLSIDDILEMNQILRKHGYKNKFYLQKFLDVENLGKLKQSVRIINTNKLGDDFELRNF